MIYCKDCIYFQETKKGERGAIKGSCRLRNTAHYQDFRYGKSRACRYFESKAPEAVCESCPEYDKEEGVCKACECWPYMDCDDPLPCEDPR